VAWSILDGDCIDVMRTLPAESVDALITSPPYAMQRKATYGGVPESEYPAWTVAWMTEARRLLKPDGSAVINIRPHVKNGQISDYTLRTRLALREAGWAEVEELIWHKKGGAPLGHVQRPRRSWESLHWFAKHGRPYCDPKAAGTPSDQLGFRGGRAVGAGWSHEHDATPRDQRQIASGIARVSDFLALSTRKHENDTDLNRHPAAYPPALAEWVARLVCPPGGTILDPFNGSASTGVAAIRNGWDYIGIEAVPEYADMSRRRLAALDEAAA
jgi:DNA modification methylase